MVGDMGLKSTAVDLTRFTQMLLNDGKTGSGVELLSAASVKLMRTPCVISTPVCVCLSDRSYSSKPCSWLTRSNLAAG
jgi:CubicO group peptidase (beta-lactamase class C family)